MRNLSISIFIYWQMSKDKCQTVRSIKFMAINLFVIFPYHTSAGAWRICNDLPSFMTNTISFCFLSFFLNYFCQEFVTLLTFSVDLTGRCPDPGCYGLFLIYFCSQFYHFLPSSCFGFHVLIYFFLVSWSGKLDHWFKSLSF